MSELSFLTLIMEASLLVQGVMFILLLMSLISWSLILQNFSMLKKAHRAYQQFDDFFCRGADLSTVYEYLLEKKEKITGVEVVIKAGFRTYIRLGKQEMPALIYESAQRAMQLALSKEEQNLEKKLPFLATVGSISVYIGLFGTVWGIMNAFKSLAVMQQATLAMVAPGISEALVATALGLFAAIPALVAYNYCLNKVDNLLKNYEHLSEDFLTLIHRRLYKSQIVPEAWESC